jgi:predicted amino acid dehydrogenase
MAIVEPKGIKVVTGNTLTAVIGYHNFKHHIEGKLEKDEISIGIIGATGNIGSILSKKFMLDNSIHPRKLVLFGKSNRRLEELKMSIVEHDEHKRTKIMTSIDLMDLRKCNAIINTANTNDPIIYANQLLKIKPVIISDISIPAGISDEIQLCPNVEVIPFIASVTLPQDADFLVTSCSPRGTALCCAAEAILASFENIPIDLRGDISLEGFDMIYNLAIKHGFIENTKVIRSYKSNSSHEVPV